MIPSLPLLGACAGLLASTAIAATSSDSETCYAGVKIFTARGTFEPQGLGVQGPTITKILAAVPNSSVSQIIYPATLNDFAQSQDNGTENALQQITAYGTACPDSKIVVMGYSQGAAVIADALDGGPAVTAVGTVASAVKPLSRSIGKNIIAVVLFGDPNQAQQGVNNAINPCPNSAAFPRNGTAYSNMAFYADRLDEYCTKDDDVCCNGGTSFAAHLSYWTDELADTVSKYIAAKFAGASGSGNGTSTTASTGIVPTGSSKPSGKPSGSGWRSAKPTGTISLSGTGSAPTSAQASSTTAAVTPGSSATTSAQPSGAPFKGDAAAAARGWSWAGAFMSVFGVAVAAL